MLGALRALRVLEVGVDYGLPGDEVEDELQQEAHQRVSGVEVHGAPEREGGGGMGTEKGLGTGLGAPAPAAPTQEQRPSSSGPSETFSRSRGIGTPWRTSCSRRRTSA